MLVSFIWHSDWAFGKLWMRSKGFNEESFKAKMAGKSLTSMWAVMAVLTIVEAFVLAVLFHSLVVTTIGGMFLLALCVWVGFTIPAKAGDYLFGGETLTSFLLSIGHELVIVVIMSLIIGLWS